MYIESNLLCIKPLVLDMTIKDLALRTGFFGGIDSKGISTDIKLVMPLTFPWPRHQYLIINLTTHNSNWANNNINKDIKFDDLKK